MPRPCTVRSAPPAAARLAAILRRIAGRAGSTDLPVDVRAVGTGSVLAGRRAPGRPHGRLRVEPPASASRTSSTSPTRLGLSRAYVAGRARLRRRPVAALPRRPRPGFASRARPSARDLALATAASRAHRGPGRPAPPARAGERGAAAGPPALAGARPAPRPAITMTSPTTSTALLGASLVYFLRVLRRPDGHARGGSRERQARADLPQAAPAPGERLLDIGCGWGSLVLHAAAHHGVHALGITLSGSRPQLARGGSVRPAWRPGRGRVATTATCRGAFDKIASVGMVEHVGARAAGRLLGAYRGYCAGRAGPQPRHRAPATASRRGGATSSAATSSPTGTCSRRPTRRASESRRPRNPRRRVPARALRAHAAALARQPARPPRAAIDDTDDGTERVWGLYMGGRSARAFEDADIQRLPGARGPVPARLTASRSDRGPAFVPRGRGRPGGVLRGPSAPAPQAAPTASVSRSVTGARRRCRRGPAARRRPAPRRRR